MMYPLERENSRAAGAIAAAVSRGGLTLFRGREDLLGVGRCRRRGRRENARWAALLGRWESKFSCVPPRCAFRQLRGSQVRGARCEVRGAVRSC